MSRVKPKLSKQSARKIIQRRKSVEPVMRVSVHGVRKPYKVTGLGNYLYIDKPESEFEYSSLGLASREKIEHVVFGLNTPVEIDVDNISPAQLGNVMETVKIIGKRRHNLDVTSVKRNGKPVIIVRKK